MEKGKLPIKERRALRVKSVELAVEMVLNAEKRSFLPFESIMDPIGADLISSTADALYAILAEKSAKEVFQPDEKIKYGRR